MKIIGIIPARFGSTRFEGKPLVDICGKSMIQRVYERATNAIDIVYVATDDERIASEVKSFGGNVVLTHTTHSTGTNRCLEASNKITEFGIEHDVVINIQGDEPLLESENLKVLASLFDDENVTLATLIKKSDANKIIEHNDGVFVVKNKLDFAMYFSRSAIPFLRDYSMSEWNNHHQFYKHIGVYGYTVSALKTFAKMEQSSIEIAECLEQNRWLENGNSIKIAIVEDNGLSVDTPKDLEKVIKHIQNNA